MFKRPKQAKPIFLRFQDRRERKLFHRFAKKASMPLATAARTLVIRGLKATELATACVTNLADECQCTESYLDRGLRDPGCEYCAISKHILPMAKEIING